MDKILRLEEVIEAVLVFRKFTDDSCMLSLKKQDLRFKNCIHPSLKKAINQEAIIYFKKKNNSPWDYSN